MYKIWLTKTTIIFLLSLVLISVVYKIIVIDRVYFNVDYSLSEEIDTIVVGASHLETAFDDQTYPNAINFSKSGMPYFFTYDKSIKILKANPHIKKLVVSLSPIHVSPYGDSTLFSDESLSRENSFVYFPIMTDYKSLGNRRFSLDFILSYLKYNIGVPFNYMEDLKPFVFSLKRKLKLEDMAYSGKYSPIVHETIPTEFIVEKTKLYFGDKITYSEKSITAITKLAKKTSEFGVQLYILNMPTNELFRKLTPKEYYEKHRIIVERLLQNYSHIKYVDYYKFPLDDDDFFDGDHVNIKGANKLALALKKDVMTN